ncbi:Tyrosine-protein kinase [Ceratobasidium sp. AG-Ba]|nr:Tyrosine-protein kinase [Ceratobasidium sp. AG-Ba]
MSTGAQLLPIHHLYHKIVIEVNGLVKRKLSRLPDPFAVIFSDGERIGSTSIIKKTLGPRWNESFNLIARDSSIITIQVLDQRMSKSRNQGFLGEVSILVSDIMEPMFAKLTLELQPQNLNDNIVVRGDMTVYLSTYTGPPSSGDLGYPIPQEGYLGGCPLSRVPRRRGWESGYNRISHASYAPPLPYSSVILPNYGPESTSSGSGSTTGTGGKYVRTNSASTGSGETGPISGQDAAITATTLGQMMRKSDSASRPEEEGESPEENNREREELLREQLAEEGYDIWGVQSVHVASPHHISPLDPFIENPPESSMHWTGEKEKISTAPAEDPSYTSPTLYRPEATSPISRFMSISEIVLRLGEHGCEDVTNRLDVASSGEFPVSRGGFGDVYKGKMLDETQIAIKTMRITVNSTNESTRYLKDAARELYTWSKCNHTNVIKLLGLARYRNQIGMVSIWAEHGHLPGYISQNPEADRCWISAQVCNGLAHLHSCDVVHGDLKGLNVLISSSGVPMLTDFGNAILRDYTLQFTGTTTRSSVSPRWAAPELLEGSTTFSKEADVYALAMETITGRVPYYEKGDHAVWFAVGVKREMPQRPGNTISTNSEQGDILWTLLISCWSHEPKERPSAGAVASTMKSIKSRNIVQATEIHWALGVQLG